MRKWLCDIHLDSPTAVQAGRWNADGDSGAVTVGYQVIEWNDPTTNPSVPIKSVQRGMAFPGSTTIRDVDPQNSVLRFLGFRTISNGTYSNDPINGSVPIRIDLTGPNRVSAFQDASGYSAVFFEVVEHKPGFIQSLQRGTVRMSAGATWGVTSLAYPVDLERASLSYSGLSTRVGPGGTLRHWLSGLLLTSDRDLEIFRGNADGGIGEVTVGYQVVEY